MKKILALLLALTMVFAWPPAVPTRPRSRRRTTALQQKPRTMPKPERVQTPGGDRRRCGRIYHGGGGKAHPEHQRGVSSYEMTDDSDNVIGIDARSPAPLRKAGPGTQIDNMDFDAALLAAQQGKSDIVMAGVTVNEDRLAVMDFTDSYATGVQVVIVKEGSDVTLDNLGEQMIGTQRATTGNIYCTDDYGEDHVVAYDDGITAVQALLNGRVDCVVIDSGPAQSL